jgi:uncharacterized membrane protein YbhN (UPF0104 family)
MLEPLSRGYSSLTTPACIQSVVLSLLAWVVQIAVALIAVRAIGADVPAGGVVMAVFAVNAASVVPLTPANIGIFQIAFIFTLSAFGVERTTSLALATVYQGVLVLPVTALGLVLLHSRPQPKTCSQRP